MEGIKDLIESYQPGKYTTHELRIAVLRLTGSRSITKKLVRSFEVMHSGLIVFKKLRSAANGRFSYLIPTEDKWKDLMCVSEKEKAQWFLENCPDVGTLEYNMFKRLCKAFGLGGNEFYYWLRKLG